MKAKCDEALSNFACSFNLRRYTMDEIRRQMGVRYDADADADDDADADGGAVVALSLL